MGRDEEVAHHPLWAPDGNQLFYFAATLPMAVDVRTQPTIGFGRPVPLASLTANEGPSIPRNSDVAPDGSRFVTAVLVPRRSEFDRFTFRPPPLDRGPRQSIKTTAPGY